MKTRTDIYTVQDEQGWSDDTMFDLAMSFLISAALLDEFHAFLVERSDPLEEDDAE